MALGGNRNESKAPGVGYRPTMTLPDPVKMEVDGKLKSIDPQFVASVERLAVSYNQLLDVIKNLRTETAQALNQKLDAS